MGHPAKVPQTLDRWLEPIVLVLIRLFPRTHPNWYTILGIILIPPTILLLPEYWYGALFLFVIGLFLDLVDGPVARKRDLTTVAGGYLDPLRDKLLFLGMLWYFRTEFEPMLIWIITTIEIALLSHRTFKLFSFRHAEKKVRAETQMSKDAGKFKFGFEAAAIIAIFLAPQAGFFQTLAHVALAIACVLGLMSLWSHVRSDTN